MKYILVPVKKITEEAEVAKTEENGLSDEVIEEIFGAKPVLLTEQEKRIHNLVSSDVLVYKVIKGRIEVLLRRREETKFRLTRLNKDLSEKLLKKEEGDKYGI
jgi:hypothetical protein